MNQSELFAALKVIQRPKPEAVETSIGTMYVRHMTGAEVDHVISKNRKSNESIPRLQIVGRCLCDVTGEPIVDVEEQTQLELIGRISNVDLQKLFDVACSINGLSKSDPPAQP